MRPFDISCDASIDIDNPGVCMSYGLMNYVMSALWPLVVMGVVILSLWGIFRSFTRPRPVPGRALPPLGKAVLVTPEPQLRLPAASGKAPHSGAVEPEGILSTVVPETTWETPPWRNEPRT